MRSTPILAAVLAAVAFSAAEPSERATKGPSLAPADGVLWLGAPEDVNDGGAAFYTLSVTNGGVDVIPGPIVVELEYSAAFGGAVITPEGWSCVLGATTGTCTWPNDLGPGGATVAAGFLFTVLPPYGDEVTCDFFRSPCILLRGQIVGYGSAVATSAVSIGQNVPPNAEQDFYFFGPVPAPIDADVLSNDSDVNGDFLFISIVDPLPAHGTATVDPVTRHIVYTPDGTGADDAVRYRIGDSYGGVDTAFAHFGNLPGGIAFDTPLANIGQVEAGRVAMVTGAVHNTTGFELQGTFSLEELDPAEIPGVLASAGYPAGSAVVFDPSVFLPRDAAGVFIPTADAGTGYMVRPNPGFGTVWLARLRLTAFPPGSPLAVRTATTVMAARTALPNEVPVHVRDDAETIPPDQPTMLHPLFNDNSASGAPLTISSLGIVLFDEPVPPGSWGALEFAEDTNGGPPWTGVLVTPNQGFLGTGIFYYAASEMTGPPPSFTNRYDFATFTVTVANVPPPPTAVASGSTTICAGASAGLTGSGGVSCSWSPATGLDDASSCSPTASPASTTTYTLTVYDQQNQASTNNPTVTISVEDLPTAVASGSTTITLGQSAPLSGSGGATCSWAPSTGLDDASSCTPVASPVVTTTYSLVVASATGCLSTNSATATITVVPPPPVAVASGSATICAGASTALSGSGGVSCSWSPATGLDDASSCTPIATPATTTTYALTVLDPDGQPSTNNPTVTVTVNALPIAVAGGSATISAGQSTPLSGSGGASCAWSPATGLDNASSCTPMASPLVTTTYSLVVASAAGCLSTNPASATITVITGTPADLVISALDAPEDAEPGETITVSITTRNAGAEAAGASTTRLYLSMDGILDAGDPVVGSASILGLAAGGTHTFTAGVTMPLHGNRFLIAVADADGQLAETDESNNTRSAKVKVKRARP